MPRTRGNGEGSFDRLPSGKWRYRKTVLTPAGTYKALQASAKTKSEARDKLRKLEEKYTKGITDMTLREFSEEYINIGCVANNIKKTTIEKTIRPTFANRINPALGDKKLVELRHREIQEWVNKLSDSKCLRRNQRLSSNGVEKILHVLSSSLEWAVQQEYIASNPARKIGVPDRSTKSERDLKRDQKDEDYLSEEELSLFLAEIKTPNKYPTKNVMLFMLLTGCRPGEALGLTWGRVKEDRIRIDQTLEEIHGQPPYLDELKTAKSAKNSPIRDIARTPSLEAILAEQKQAQREYRKMCGLPWKPELDLVFTQPDGKAFTGRMLYYQVEKAGKAIGLTDSEGNERRLHPHSLRHTFITLMVSSKTMTLTEVQHYVGHANPQTTDNYYNLGQNKRNRINGEKVEQFFTGTRTEQYSEA